MTHTLARGDEFTCPACHESREYDFTTSRYTQEPICSTCATREALEGAFWPAAWHALRARYA